MSEDCLFCKIAAGEIPSQEVASDAETYAFRDIDPQAPVHVLVVPRTHIADADHLQPDDGPVLAALFATARRVAEQEGLSPAAGGKGYRLVMNVGPDASNTVPHLHLHVIGGRQMTWPPG